MANAWCINAIWFDWCFIQTLQQLDSACIWVWVQYTAPNPLDDKRFDYIKYTDKCWNTCCLTWENEILIYATNWTLKNLTLTNDADNEFVNVKRTDVFWSNWKKTVVRYKTWWYPSSASDWTLAVEELTQNQYSSSWFNVSWLDSWTTYYFSVFAIAQDDSTITVLSKNITPEYWIPAEYQEVEYIQNTWTQYIRLWLTPTTSTQCETKIELTTTEQDITVLWTYYNSTSVSSHLYYHLTPYQNKRYFATYNAESNWWTYSPTIWKQYTIVFNNASNYLNVDWVNIVSVSWTAWYSWSDLCVWARATNNARYWKFKYFYFKVYDKSQQKYVRDLVPCYRVSDGVIWLYDKITWNFYTNSWSWTFLKWREIPRWWIQQVDYIQTTWTQFINTELFANSNTQIETKITTTTWDTTNAIPIFGSYTTDQTSDTYWNYYHLTPFSSKFYFWKNNSRIKTSINHCRRRWRRSSLNSYSK